MQYDDFKLSNQEAVEQMAKEYNRRLIGQGFTFVRLNNEKDEQSISDKNLNHYFFSALSLLEKLEKYAPCKNNLKFKEANSIANNLKTVLTEKEQIFEVQANVAFVCESVAIKNIVKNFCLFANLFIENGKKDAELCNKISNEIFKILYLVLN